MKKILALLGTTIALALGSLTLAPSAFALHSPEWAVGVACAQTQAYANSAGATGPCGYYSSQWNLPSHPNRFWVVAVHNLPEPNCHPDALVMGVEVTDGGVATTNFNTWYWAYGC